MESIVEDSYLWSGRQEVIDGTDTSQVSLVVDWCEVDKALDAFLHLRRYDAALVEEVATLHDTVTNGVNLIEALDGAYLGVSETFEDQLNAFLVCGEVAHDFLFRAVRELHLDECVVDADALNTTLCEDALVVHVVQLILNRTATAVKYQNLHLLITNYYLQITN